MQNERNTRVGHLFRSPFSSNDVPHQVRLSASVEEVDGIYVSQPPEKKYRPLVYIRKYAEGTPTTGGECRIVLENHVWHVYKRYGEDGQQVMFSTPTLPSELGNQVLWGQVVPPVFGWESVSSGEFPPLLSFEPQT